MKHPQMLQHNIAAAQEAVPIVQAINFIESGQASNDEFLLVYRLAKSNPGLMFMALDHAHVDIEDPAHWLADLMDGLDEKLETAERINAVHLAVHAINNCEATHEQCALIQSMIGDEEPQNDLVMAAEACGMDGRKFLGGLLADRMWFVEKSQTDAEELAAMQEEQRLRNAERSLSGAVEKFKAEFKVIANDALSAVYCDVLPHVLGDTEANIGHRVQYALTNILQKKFELIEGTNGSASLLKVDDGYGGSHYIVFSVYSEVIKPIVDAYPEQLKTARIEQLEEENRTLRARWNQRP